MKNFFLCRTIMILLMVHAGNTNASSTVSAPFTGTPIAAGNKIWFSAAVKITGTATYPLTIYFTGQTISSPAFSLTVPDAILILDPSVSVATTVFNGVSWVTTARPGESGYYFLSGYRDSLTTSLPGSLSPVSWTGTFTASRPGVSILWHMAAAVYTSFNSNLNNLGVKPSDCSSCSAYSNSHSSGSPENYLPYVISGARGGGGSNYTGGFSGADHVSPDAINYNTSVCVGSSVTLHTVSTCSSWSSSNHSVATVSGGVVTGIAAGTSRISYLVAGSPMWQVATVNVLAPPTITATASPAVMCAGATLTLNATTSASGSGCGEGAVISWHGPAGFSSTLEDPKRNGMTPEMAGVYSVTVTDNNGCAGTATTAAVVVRKLPASITAIVTPIPVCAGNTIFLNGTVTGGSGYSLQWTGGSSTINNSTTTSANITSAALSDAGTYSLTATAAGCPGNTRGTATLPAVRKLPTTLTATANPSPVCQGNSVTLRATSTGSAGTISYMWTGPASGSSIVNPTSITTASITATNLANTGIYTVTASAEGCGTMAAYTSMLHVNKLPSITAAVNPNPVCVGGTFSLTGTIGEGAGYTLLWTGGTSTIHNNMTAIASVTSASLTDAGSYTLTATAPACGSASGNTNAIPLIVNPAPTSTGPTNSGTVCAGGLTTLYANSVGATTWSWTGPGGFSSSLQNPTVTASTTGIFSLVVGNTGGCSSAIVYTTIVSVNAAPSITATGGGTICNGASRTLTAIGGTTYSWSPSTGLSSATGATVVASPSSTTVYTVTGTTSGCSNTATVMVSVNAAPSITATGGGTICNGASTTLIATGGTTYSWSPSTGLSSATGATVVASPSLTTVYTVTGTTSGCSNTATVMVSVNAAPSITATGGGTICNGAATTLTATGGSTYSWSPSTGLPSATGATVVASPSSTTVYTVTGTTSGCSNTATVMVSVNAAPSITATGGGTICNGASRTLTAIGGTTYSWSPSTGLSSATGATVVASQSLTTVYTVTGTTSGCSNTATVMVSVNAAPSITATGGDTICNGASRTLTATGGTTYSWSPSTGLSSATGATVVASQSSTIVYTVTGTTSGCSNTATVTVSVNSVPTITATGGGTICNGASATLTATGGTPYSWSPSSGLSSATGATVVASPSSTTVYTVTGTTSGCSNTATVTVSVNAAPTITATGGGTICNGASATLSATGGTTYSWSPSTGLSSATGATVVASQSSTTVYTVTGTTSGCSNTATVTVSVNAAPSITATGGGTICNGASTTLTATGGATYSWSPSTGLSAATGATVVASPSSTTVYTVTGTTSGCSNTATVSVSVNPLPDAGTITGPGSVCVSSTITLSNCTGGGTWSSGSTSIATVDAGGTVTGVAPGTAVISYTITNDCGSATATKIVTVNSVTAGLTGPSNVDVGSDILLSVTGGNWNSSNTSIATVDATGTVTGVSNGTATISYTMSNSCFSFSVTKIVTVNTASITPITGVLTVCVGNTTTLTNATAGGTWSSDNTAVATVSSAGIITGIGEGTATISYSLLAGMTTVVVSVYPLPAPITGVLNACAGSTTVLSNSDEGGTWTISPTTVATIGSTSGIVTPSGTSGTATVTYTLPTGCYITTVVTVNLGVAAIGGPTVVCSGHSVTLTNATLGGSWSSSNSAVATVGSGTGLVSGISPGIVDITYSVGAGCFVTTEVTVAFTPMAIAGTLTVCQGMTTALTNGTGGGSWSSANTGVATVGSGIVTGIAGGTAVISYTTAAGCSTSVVVSVSTLQPISGPSLICIGTSATLTDATTGGTWSSNNTSIATVGSTTGVVTGVSAGIATITYTLGSGCYRTTTVNISTLTPITGTPEVCIGLTTTLANATPGGIWTTTNPAIAAINSTGVVTGVSMGTNTISYALGSCKATLLVTVLPSPAMISGLSTVCEGASITLMDATTGGTWSTSSGNITISGTATTSLVVTGVTPGVATVTYSAGTVGCYRLFDVTVRALPDPIAGTFTVCPGGLTLLTDPTAGGTWSSSNATIATVVVGSGAVAGNSTGTATITYKVAGGCITTAVVTVIASPSAILGPLNVCTGSSITLSDTSGSGTWVSSNVGLATVGSLTGIVTGVMAGTPSITFTLAATGCRIKAVVTVTAIPNAGTLSGPTVTGVGSSITITSTGTPGGAWSTSNSNATVSTTGVVTGVAAGTCIVTYAATNECGYSGAYKPITIAAGRAAPTTPGRPDVGLDGTSGLSTTGNGTKDFAPINNSVIGYTTHVPVVNPRRTFGQVASTPDNIRPSDVRIIPNPNSGTFAIRGMIGATSNEMVDMEIRSIPGQLIYKSKLMPKNGIIEQQVQLNNNLPNGMYLLSVRSNTECKVVHFVMEH